jgi:hypothetical protein
MQSPTVLRSLSIALLAVPAPLAPARGEALDAEARQALVGRIGELLTERFVFPEVAGQCKELLQARFDAGAFDELVESEALAGALTAELQGVSGDKHLVVHAFPPGRARTQEREDPEAARLRRLDELRRQNFGFARVEHLDDNIGYVDMRSFAPSHLARDTAAAAMTFVAGCDAVILDMRENGGGNPDMVQLVCSYFFGERTHLNSLYWREGDRTQEFWTLDEVPGARMPDVPLYVLTSSRTFSGAEELTYNLRTRERATVIGERTRGGAHPGTFVDLDERFGMFVPVGRAINPVTGTNWEGVGVEPHIAAPADDALERALAEARPAARAFGATSSERRVSLERSLAERVVSAQALFDEGRAEEAARVVETALREGRAGRVLDEEAINLLGYRALQSGSTETALAVFRSNADAFPGSSNAWDSLGEAYMVAGATELAIRNYRKSLALNPDNGNAARMLEKLLERGSD